MKNDCKILVVDDNFEDLELMSGILRKNGFAATAVTNGAHAMDAIEKGHFDLVLIDIQMPTLSGYDLLRLLKRTPGKRTLMAYVSILPQKHVMMEDADGFIQKPFGEKEFVAQVRKMLGC